MRWGRMLAAGAVLGLMVGGGWWVWQRGPVDTVRLASDAIDADTMRLVPDSVRIKVEVLNATGQRGLARRVAQYLRDRGFDVVGIGDAPLSDSSVVYDRAGNSDWAAWGARAMQGARIELRPDSVRYLDLTLVIGRAFRPPSQVLYP
jgi:hypothetical protein